MRIYVAVQPCDMRKQFDALVLLVEHSMGRGPVHDVLDKLAKGWLHSRLAELMPRAGAAAQQPPQKTHAPQLCAA